MGWKYINDDSVAKVGAKDLEGRFYYSDAASDPPEALRIALTYRCEEGPNRHADLLVSDHVDMSSVTMAAGLATLRDAGLPASGAVED